ncbi:hypothetical protein SO802_027801 [Lithocarpus litseifolius]|uniref:Uncharacterized protein n=1 Tax=Lithocarpus litseifolius TaxID=425828 RepID=A0AAW2BQU2_9ROSI
MPSLRRLKFQFCCYLSTIANGLRFVTTLQELEIQAMPKTFKHKVDIGGEDFYKVQHAPSLIFSNCEGFTAIASTKLN